MSDSEELWVKEAEAIIDSVELEINQQNKKDEENEASQKEIKKDEELKEDQKKLSGLKGEELLEKWNELVLKKQKNEEILRKLHLVETHEKKNNIKDLKELIFKWRKTCQEALQELLTHAPKTPPITMLQLICCLGLDVDTIGFDTISGQFKPFQNS